MGAGFGAQRFVPPIPNSIHTPKSAGKPNLRKIIEKVRQDAEKGPNKISDAFFKIFPKKWPLQPTYK
jgi:hypothetical protein